MSLKIGEGPNPRHRPVGGHISSEATLSAGAGRETVIEGSCRSSSTILSWEVFGVVSWVGQPFRQVFARIISLPGANYLFAAICKKTQLGVCSSSGADFLTPLLDNPPVAHDSGCVGVVPLTWVAC